MKLENKVAVLTGALGTLGQMQALYLAKAGARLVLLDRPELNPDSLLSELKEHGVDAVYVGHDLTDLSGSAQHVLQASDEFGGADILINNAALIINRPHQEFSLDEYEEQIRVNSTAPFALAQALAPRMIAKGYGKIVNFCSLTLNGQWDGYVPYVTSKGAMLGFTRSLARELGRHGIRVNAVSPGAILSDAENRVFKDRLQQYNDWCLEHQCLKVRGKAEDVANLVLFLVSPESDFITGQNIAVDGGW